MGREQREQSSPVCIGQPGRTLGFAFQGGCDGSSCSKTHWDFDASKVWPSHSSSLTLLVRCYQKHFLIKLLLTGQGSLAPHNDKYISILAVSAAFVY